MRFVSFSTPHTTSFGLLTDDGTGVIDLADRVGANDLGELVESGQLEAAHAFANETRDHAVDDITYERLLPWPGKIFCIGLRS